MQSVKLFRERVVLAIVVAAWMAFFVNPASLAQGRGGRASLSGQVLDPHGAAVVEAKVSAINEATGVVSETISNPSGVYAFTALDVGTYTVSATKEGFKKGVVNGVLLNIDQQSNLNLTLNPGGVQETVEVRAEQSDLHPTNGALSDVIDERRIVELPLQGRNAATLVFLVPGTVDALRSDAGARQDFLGYPDEQVPIANGGRQGNTYFMLDGTSNMDTYMNLSAPFPNPEAIGEFRVTQNNFDAQYGYGSGAVVNIATKAGSNQFHGNLFEFVRNNVFNARSFFATDKDTLKRNQYGGSLGGPILRDKLFFFGNYQRTSVRQTFPAFLGNTITDNRRIGDFSDWQARGETEPIDPLTGSPFPGDQIPAARLDPVSVGLLVGLPHAQNPDGTYLSSGSRNVVDENQFVTRGDWTINPKHRVYARWFYTKSTQPNQTGGGDFFLVDRSWESKYSNASVNYTWLISSSMVNNATFSWGNLNTHSVTPLTAPDGSPVSLSLLGANIAEPLDRYPAMIDSFGTEMWGFGGNLNDNFRRNMTAGDSFTWSKGNHLLAMGIDVLAEHGQLGTDWGMNPYLSIGSYYGSMNNDANFMLGLLGSFTQGSGQFMDVKLAYPNMYINDTYKIKPNLTLSYGVRWEPNFGASIGGDKMAVYIKGYQSTRFPLAPVDLAFVGDPGVPKHGYHADTWNFSPRVGVAWQPKQIPHTSIRAAVGLFSDHLSHRNYENLVVDPFFPYVNLDQANFPQGIHLSDPWADYPGGSPFPQKFASYTSQGDPSIPFTSPEGAYHIWNPDFKLGKTLSWNTSIQRSFAHDIILRAAYVGSHSYNQTIQRDLNAGINGVRPNPAYNWESVYWNNGWANYRSLQLTFEKKFTKSLQFESNYTWMNAKDLVTDFTWGSVLPNPFDVSYNYGNSAANIPRTWVTNFVYFLPGQWSNPVMNGVFKGWEVSGIWSVADGRPFGIANSGNNSGSFMYADRADLTGTPVKYSGDSTHRDHYINLSAFAPNAINTFGNSPKYAYYEPATNNLDFGLHKNFAITESQGFQFRWELFNLANHPQLGLSGSRKDVSNTTTFGQLNVQRNNSRIMQLALKYTF